MNWLLVLPVIILMILDPVEMIPQILFCVVFIGFLTWLVVKATGGN